LSTGFATGVVSTGGGGVTTGACTAFATEAFTVTGAFFSFVRRTRAPRPSPRRRDDRDELSLAGLLRERRVFEELVHVDLRHDGPHAVVLLIHERRRRRRQHGHRIRRRRCGLARAELVAKPHPPRRAVTTYVRVFVDHPVVERGVELVERHRARRVSELNEPDFFVVLVHAKGYEHVPRREV